VKCSEDCGKEKRVEDGRQKNDSSINLSSD
jgi:hypothetical protein